MYSIIKREGLSKLLISLWRGDFMVFSGHNGKTISYDKIVVLYPQLSYEELYKMVSDLEAANLIKGISRSGFNGRSPKLYKQYRILTQDVDYSKELEEIKALNAHLSINYYLNKPKEYKANRAEILKLNDYFTYQYDKLQIPMSINERSFDIWGNEKYLRKSSASTLIKKLGLSLVNLNVYNTPEPFFYYMNNKEVNTVLIIENKDTWFTLRKILKENPNSTVWGYNVGVLVYGEGKKILSSIDFLYEDDLSLLHNPQIKYWGDLDYEGINIYYELKNRVDIEIELFTPAYEEMLKTASVSKSKLNCMSDKQKIANLDVFLNYFTTNNKTLIIEIFNKGLYIPQEIINYTLFMEGLYGE